MEHSAKEYFVECRPRQTHAHGDGYFCLPSVKRAFGKGFIECLKNDTSAKPALPLFIYLFIFAVFALSSVALDKRFAECFFSVCRVPRH